ncbi:MAG: DUF308 domain-containing protein [Polyangiaceae bacterium]|nr:DUF308 domain-containing protein [Polyangiaceae bacterium]
MQSIRARDPAEANQAIRAIISVGRTNPGAHGIRRHRASRARRHRHLAPLASTYIATILIGVFLVAGGILRVVHGFEHRYRPGIGWLVLSAVFYIGAGAAILWAPLIGALSLTVVVGAFFILSAVSKAIRAYQVRESRATGWLLFDAIVSAFLGILLLAGFPSTAFWALGIIVGMDLIIGGITMIGLMGRAKGTSSI